MATPNSSTTEPRNQKQQDIHKSDIAQLALDLAYVHVAGKAGGSFLDQLTYCVNRTDYGSPIEAIFQYCQYWWFAASLANDIDMRLTAQAQYKFKRKNGRHYLLDFGIMSPSEVLLVAVEIDGHEFHERTRKQVQDRNERDRELQDAGINVAHFSYLEMVNDPLRCVIDAFGLAYQHPKAKVQ